MEIPSKKTYSSRMSQTAKKVRAKERAKTRRLQRQRREQARTAKESLRELPAGTLSRPERLFTKGLNTYRNYFAQQKFKKIIQTARAKVNTLEKNKFYLKDTRGNAIALKDVNEYYSFVLLYVGKNPSQSYSLEFLEDVIEDDFHQEYYISRVYSGPSYLFFIDNNALSELSEEERFHFWGRYEPSEIDMVNNPFTYLLSEVPGFNEAYTKDLAKAGLATEKLEGLREKGLETAIRRAEERTGQSLGENVEARLRSFLSPRPHARNYNGTQANFQAINTSLFQ